MGMFSEMEVNFALRVPLSLLIFSVIGKIQLTANLLIENHCQPVFSSLSLIQQIPEKKWHYHEVCHHHAVQSVPPFPWWLSLSRNSTDQKTSPAWGLLQHNSFWHQSINKCQHEFYTSQKWVSFARGCLVGTLWFGSVHSETPTMLLKGFL